MIMSVDVHALALWWLRTLPQGSIPAELHLFAGLWGTPPTGGSREATCEERRNVPERGLGRGVGGAPFEKCEECASRARELFGGTPVISHAPLM